MLLSKFEQGRVCFCRRVPAELFLQESSCELACRLPQPALRLLSFHEESNQRRAKEEVSSLETPLGGTSPVFPASGESAPCLLRQWEDVKYFGYCLGE